MPDSRVSLAEAARVWARIGLLSFGGPAGQIALMHRVVVEERGWVDDARFLHGLNVCMLLPGPEAMQLAAYLGWLTHGLRGAALAAALFILPGALAVLGLSMAYALYGQVGLVAAVFTGLKAAVLAIVLQAVARLWRRVLGRPALVAVAVLSFVAIFAFAVPFPAIILGAALLGWAGALGAAPAEAASAQPLSPARHRNALFAGGAALALWLLPVALLHLLAGPGSPLTGIATFFSQLAVLTFGGAYAALAWVAQEAVVTHGWLAPGEMLDGLGLAETTPGPLILVLEFVGFLASFRDPGPLPPLLAGALGAALAVWVTFVPAFAWILLSAPFMERMRRAPRLASALAAVTAAVVGVVLNLAVWFALNTVFGQTRTLAAGPLSLAVPVPASVDPVAATLSLAALAAVWRFHPGTGTLLGGAALCGLALGLAGLA